MDQNDHPQPGGPTIEVAARWELLPPNRIAGFWEEVGKVETGSETFTLGASVMGAPTLYVMTKRPHPDDPRRTQTWALPARKVFAALVERLLDPAAATTATDTTATEGAPKDGQG